MRNFLLPEEDIPKKWFNILPDLIGRLPKHLDPVTKEPLKASKLEEIIPKELVNQELALGIYCSKREIDIPDDVLDAYRVFRPTPLVRAYNLEKFLKTPAKIFYKREDVSPVGSHKLNTAFPQVFYAKKEGTKTLVTDTGAGQWGSAMAMACNFFGLKSIVFMIRKSYNDKPFRVLFMRLFGADVIQSPSNQTKAGRIALKTKDSGSLGIGMSEAIETAKRMKDAKIALGCMSNYAVLHQTIIGNELEKQLTNFDITPDMMIGCVGGGSNFAGMTYPFLKNKDINLLAVESSSIPAFTKGKYRYDFQDYIGLMPMIKMYTLGHTFQPPAIHAGGLRYHGKTSTLSLLVKEGRIKARSYPQDSVLKAGKIFAETECIIPAPESSHAIMAVIEEAIKCKKRKETKTIIFNLSGHGILDLKAYEKLMK